MFADGRHVQAGENDATSSLVEDGCRVMSVVARSGPGLLRSAAHVLLAGDMFRLQASEETVSLLMSQSGDAAMDGVPTAARLSRGQILLMDQAMSITPARRDPVSLLVIEIPRAAIQAEAFAQTGIPRRLGRVDMLLDGREAGGGFVHRVGALASTHAISGPADAADRAIISGLVKELAARGDQGDFFPVAGSVRRALDRLATIGPDPVSLDDIVKASGVVHTTLRRAMKEVTGVPLGHFMKNARLDWFRVRLRDDRESRSLRELAAVAGYHPAVCSRAYQRRFGETPTQTRAEAFASPR